MAQPGTFGAYRQEQPIREDFGDNMLQAENQQFKYRAEEREKERMEYRKQRDMDQDLQAAYDKMSPVITGLNNVDQANTRLINQGMEELGEITRQMSNPGLTNQERQALIHRKNMITKMPEFMAAASKNITSWVDATTKGMQDGSISKWDMYELDQAEAHFDYRGESGAAFTIEDGVPVGYVKTKDGDMEKISYLDVVQGYKFGAHTSFIDKDKWVETKVNNLGKLEEAAFRAGQVGTEQTFEGHKKYVSDDIDAALGSAEDPSDLAKTMWVDYMGKDPREFDEKSVKKIKDNLMQSVKAGYDKTFSGRPYRPPSTDDDNETASTAGERTAIKSATALYDISNGIVDLNPESIRSVTSYSKTEGEDRIALGVPQYIESENSLLFVDKEGKPLQKVNLDDKEAAAREVAMIISGKKDPAEVHGQYETGSEYSKYTPSEFRVAGAKRGQVSTLNTDVFQTLNNSGNAYAIKTQLERAFEDTNFKFGYDNTGGDRAITIVAGGGEFEFPITEDGDIIPGALDNIKKFLEESSIQEERYTTTGKPIRRSGSTPQGTTAPPSYLKKQ